MRPLAKPSEVPRSSGKRYAFAIRPCFYGDGDDPVVGIISAERGGVALRCELLHCLFSMFLVCP